MKSHEIQPYGSHEIMLVYPRATPIEQPKTTLHDALGRPYQVASLQRVQQGDRLPLYILLALGGMFSVAVLGAVIVKVTAPPPPPPVIEPQPNVDRSICIGRCDRP